MKKLPMMYNSRMKKVRIYTKTGDKGTTSLMGGQRVDKNSVRIRAYGEVDELNSLIGVILSEDSFAWAINTPSKALYTKAKDLKMRETYDISQKLLRIQNELFILGSDLATPLNVKTKIPRLLRTHVARLEKEIDIWTRKLPILKNFIIPGGGRIRSQLHLARTVVRRAERSIVDLSILEKINNMDMLYINRLSDWFFTLARYITFLENDEERIWKGRNR